MKSLTWLLKSILTDISIRCDTDTHRDFLTMSRRIESEGISFLTITLPNFCSDFERSLDQKQVSSDLFLGFKKRQSLPAFLQGLTRRIFDPVDGKLLDKPCIESIASIRQLCLMFKKIQLPCSPERVNKAYAGFFKCEHELTGLPSALPDEIFDLFGKISDVIWPRVLSPLDRDVYERNVIPRHGPGATAERISGNQKYNLLTWHTRLERSFPFDLFGMLSPRGLSGDEPLDRVKFVEPGSELPVRVITVPKTLKTPRIIAIEPVCMQYTQQSLAYPIMEMIESHELTSGRINFSSQQVNRDIAQSSSKTGVFATLDLSEASDRVHKDLVYRMLKNTPHLRRASFDCRSTRADVCGEVITLHKFASMGSALCFPIESMLFYTICILARLMVANLPPSKTNIKYVSQGIRVYGDDIIVPTNEVEAISFALNSFGLKVNSRKSFSRGNFRESCGMDAYSGVDVTPVYLRRMPPSDRRCESELVSFVAFANHLYTKGWWTAASRVRDYIESIFGTMPHVLDTSPCLGWTSYDSRYSMHKWCSDHHKPLVRAYKVSPAYQHDNIDGHAAAMKCLLRPGKDPTFEGHLKRTVRSGSVRIKNRWVSPY